MKIWMKCLSFELTCLFIVILNKKIGIIGELISLLCNQYFIILMGLLLAFNKWLIISNLWKEGE